MATLPRPDVNVTTTSDPEVIDVVVSRDNKARSYQGRGSSETARTKDVVKKILDDGHTAEWLP